MRDGNGRTAAHLAGLPMFLRAPRAAGLWLIGVLIPVATMAGFVLSYRGLFDWAVTHGWPLYLAPLFPLLIDLLIIAGEVVLFVAAIDGKTPRRVRAAAWAIVLAFTTLSVVGNVDHAPTSDPLTRGGWGLPPLVMAIALGFGLGELKRQAGKYRGASAAASVPAFVRPKLPPLREVQDAHGCAQATAEKIRKALRTRDAQWAQAIQHREENGNGEGRQDGDPDRQRQGRQAGQGARRGQQPEEQVAAKSPPAGEPAAAAPAPAGAELQPAPQGPNGSGPHG